MKKEWATKMAKIQEEQETIIRKNNDLQAIITKQTEETSKEITDLKAQLKAATDANEGLNGKMATAILKFKQDQEVREKLDKDLQQAEKT